MTHKELEVINNLLLKEQWYMAYTNALVKATDLDEHSTNLLVKITKPSYTPEQLVNLYKAAFGTEPVVDAAVVVPEETPATTKE